MTVEAPGRPLDASASSLLGDPVPSRRTLVIDVKGDLSNLLLRFPDLSPAAFESWVERERDDLQLPRSWPAARASSRSAKPSSGRA
jgi:hypothetical protein